MKNKFMLLLFSIIVFSLTFSGTGCTKDINTVDNQDIIKKVIEIEKNEYLLKTIQISYNDYLKAVQPLVFTNSSYLDKYDSNEIWAKVKNITTIPANRIQISEILNANKDELRKIRDRLVPTSESYPIEMTSKYEPLKISKVYDDETMKGKRVFVAQLEDVYKKGFDVMFYRSYIFRKENNEWKIFDVRNTTISGYDNPEGGYKYGEKKDLYEEYNGEKVVYDTTINLGQYDIK